MRRGLAPARRGWRWASFAVLGGSILSLGLAGPAFAQSSDSGTHAPAADAGQTAPDPNKPQPTTAKTDTQHAAQGTGGQTGDLTPSALAGAAQGSPPPGLIPGWQEVRARLGELGIGVSARYASESGYNPTGGDRQLYRETSQLDAGVLLDLAKIAGLKGGAFQATITWRRGDNLSSDAGLGVLQQVQEVYGRGQTVRVTQFWYEQALRGGLEIKVGRTDPGEDFAAFSCHFMNLTFCGAQPGNLVGDYWQNWPVGQWGGRARLALRGGAYVQIGAYEINPRNLENGFFLGHFNGATGALVPVEAGIARGGDEGRVGSYKIGGWIATGRADDVLLDTAHALRVLTGLSPLQHDTRYGVYFSGQQQLSGTSKGGKTLTGLSVFANVTQTDRATAVTDSQVALGLFYTGLFPRLAGDVLGFALGRTGVNGRAREADLLVAGTPPRGAEYATELYYGFQPIAWLDLQPNVQWIHHPGGVSARADVAVLGLKAAVTL